MQEPTSLDLEPEIERQLRSNNKEIETNLLSVVSLKSNPTSNSSSHLFQSIPTSEAQWKDFAHEMNKLIMHGTDVDEFKKELGQFLSSHAHLNSTQRFLATITNDILDTSKVTYSSVIFDCIFSSKTYSHESMMIEMSLNLPFVFKMFHALVRTNLSLKTNNHDTDIKTKYKNIYNLCMSLAQHAPVSYNLQFDKRRAVDSLCDQIRANNLLQGPFAPLIVEFYKTNPTHLKGTNSRNFSASDYLVKTIYQQVKDELAKKAKEAQTNSSTTTEPEELSGAIKQFKKLGFFKKLLHWLTLNSFLNKELEALGVNNPSPSLEAPAKAQELPVAPPSLSTIMGENYISCLTAISSLNKIYFSQKTDLKIQATKALEEYMNLFLIVENLTPSNQASIDPNIAFYLKKQFPINFLSSIDAFSKLAQACSLDQQLLEAYQMVTANLSLMMEKTARHASSIEGAGELHAFKELKVEHKYLKSSM